MSSPAPRSPTVALTTLGCARNDVDSEELAGRLAADGWAVVENDDDADAVVVNTCGFVESAKKDSVDTLLAAADTGRPVVAVGCMAERYGRELAQNMPEAAAVLGFDDYADIGARLRSVLAGEAHVAHTPRDRRTLLPISPVERPAAAAGAVGIPGHAGGPRVPRARLGSGPSAPVKLASGCDRRCTFCAIPTFRGAFTSRRPGEVLGDVQWLAQRGVREIILVSENSTSYGKDLGEPRLLETLLPQLADAVERIRVNYLQPAELRPDLVQVLATTPGVLPYFDLSFQHASGPLLRRMRRFGSTESFLELIARARALAPAAGFRTNVIVGFPGETEDDLAELERFLVQARLDSVGVFGYSDEDGTEAVGLPDKVDSDEVGDRVSRVTALVEELGAQRAAERVGETVEVLVESVDEDDGAGVLLAEGRAAHQAPEDGATRLPSAGLTVGALVQARVVGTLGLDLDAEPVGAPR